MRKSTKHITFIEPQYHHEVLQGFVSLAIASGYEVSVFTHQMVQQHCLGLQMVEMNWFVPTPNETFINMILGHQAMLAEAHLHVFVTVTAEDHELTQINWPAPKLLVIHNGYTFLDFWGRTAPKPMALVRLLRAWWQNQAQHLARWWEFGDYLSFPDATIEGHLRQTYPERISRIAVVPPLPFGIYEPDLCSQVLSKDVSQERITIVVPGTVSTNNRDYKSLLKVFRRIIPQLIQPIRLVFAGKIRDGNALQISRQFSALETTQFSFICYEEPLSQSTFDSWLCQSDFLLLPLKPYYDYGHIREYYGYSNTTGTINDLIRFGKPGLIPDFYPVPDTLSAIVQSYANETELSWLLLQWINKGGFQARQNAVPDSLADCTVSALLPQFQQTMQRIFRTTKTE